jgi:hypothetical protein
MGRTCDGSAPQRPQALPPSLLPPRGRSPGGCCHPCPRLHSRPCPGQRPGPQPHRWRWETGSHHLPRHRRLHLGGWGCCQRRSQRPPGSRPAWVPGAPVGCRTAALPGWHLGCVWPGAARRTGREGAPGARPCLRPARWHHWQWQTHQRREQAGCAWTLRMHPTLRHEEVWWCQVQQPWSRGPVEGDGVGHPGRGGYHHCHVITADGLRWARCQATVEAPSTKQHRCASNACAPPQWLSGEFGKAKRACVRLPPAPCAFQNTGLTKTATRHPPLPVGPWPRSPVRRLLGRPWVQRIHSPA